jgi:hypothetical protein
MTQSDKFYCLYSELRNTLIYDSIPSKQNYENIVEYLCNKNSTTSNISAYDRYKYSIREFEDKIMLYQGEKMVVCKEELFDIIHHAHVEETEHGGCDVLINALKRFYGISKSSFFINFYKLNF